jgi:hypothetical protein
MILPRKSSRLFRRCWFPGISGAVFVAALLVVGWGLTAKAIGQTEGPITAPSTQSAPPSAQQTPAPSDTRPNLAGKWTLNKDQSDDPREKMREAMGNASDRRDGRQRGAGGGFGTGGWGQRRPRDPNRTGLGDLSELTVEQSEKMAKVSGVSGRIVALYQASNLTNDQTSRGGTSAPPAAEWRGNQLVVTTEGRRGAKTTQTFSLSPDGGQLYLTIRSENPRFQEPLTIRFVYDRWKDSSK